ncbi:7-carboxy-7-deazaguanine synthase QueE [Fictibacillus terranigra]|uniref:7-carboxy-7-deazaguanine synthase n=1 Tax=Fictibacillus terranigra TaxID=3058424 RepID=A0ABT8E3R9_9BACL|nr:radical SAM protein [Fictibacillus sp. CENA-BCM004]MDN4072560.1 radical SAM protein [Fictibacillus sp. CENA-BCM004]
MTNHFNLPSTDVYSQWKVPMVEIFETIEGEGMAAGFPTIFVRVFHCNLRCTWCDTTYSYAPAKPEFEATIEEIIERINAFSSKRICFTGGEPLIHREKSAALLKAMAEIERIEDIHIETNGAIPLEPFQVLRENDRCINKKARFVMDYKLPASGEMDRMVHENFDYLEPQDEIKFVIGSDEDFDLAASVVNMHHKQGQVLFSPVWETMPPAKLVNKVLEARMPDVKVSMQLHKIIWHPDKRGV